MAQFGRLSDLIGPTQMFYQAQDAARRGSMENLDMVMGAQGLLARMQEQDERKRIEQAIQGSPSLDVAMERLTQMGSPGALKMVKVLADAAESRAAAQSLPERTASDAALRQARMDDLKRKGEADAEKRRAVGDLSRYLGGDVSVVGGQPPAGPTQVFKTEDEARQAAIAADQRGEQVRTWSPNPATVRSLAIRADPDGGLLKTLEPPARATGDRFGSVSPGGQVYDKTTGAFVGGQVPFRETAPQRRQVINTAAGPREWNPDTGKWEPIRDDATGRPLGPSSFTGGTLETRISEQFERNPVVKFYMEVQPDVEVVNNYMKDRARSPVAQRSVYDKNLVNTFMRFTHPKGDQISNFERKDLAGLPALPARIGQAIEGYFLGKYVPDDVAAEMARIVNDKFAERRKQVESLESKAVADLERNGLSPNAVRRVTRGTSGGDYSSLWR